MTSSPGESRRLFFALWPDPQTAAHLHAAASKMHAQCGGRPTSEENLHLTLAFLGAVPVERIPEVSDVAASIVAPGFDWQLDRLGAWRNMVWVSGGTVPALTMLAGSLASGLRSAGFAIEKRSFVPHVTLLRNARRPFEPMLVLPQITWTMREFVLAQSQADGEGVRYVVVGRWPLVAASGILKRAIKPPPSRGSKSR